MKIKNELARGEIRNLYLLHGEERFLVLFYARAIENFLRGEKNIFEGAVPVAEIIMASETIPFFETDKKRLIIIRDSKL
ncbi:MAG: hypothetical protein FWD19_06000, partial [Defluviitaleaceae bacterium]|nr:hypothetical protein [Defluviitaleaceae bacterium]